MPQPVERNGEIKKAARDVRAAPPQKKSARKTPPGDVEILARWIAYEKCDLVKVLAHYGISAIGDIPDNVFDDCMAKVKAKFPGFMPEKPFGVPAQAKSSPPLSTLAKPSRPVGVCE